MTQEVIQNLAASDYNMQKLNMAQLETHLAYSIEAGSNVVIVGQRGAGKTMIAKQQILQNGMIELYINLSVFDRADLLGYVNMFSKNNEDEFVDYRLPKMFKPLIYGDKKVVILFDEADKADTSLTAPLLEILQMKSINGRALPNLQCCILTCNLISEGSNKPPAPLMDRAECFFVEPDANVWLQWAARTGLIHASIITYIQDHPNMLCGKVDIGENYKDQSPRSWHLTSQMIRYGEAKGWSKDLILEKVGGFVGKTCAIDYANYYNHYKVLLPVADKVFNGENVKKEFKALEPVDKLCLAIIVGGRLANKLDAADPKTGKPLETDLVGKFLSIIDHEIIIPMIKATITQYRMMKWKLYEEDSWKVIRDIKEEAYGEVNV